MSPSPHCELAQLPGRGRTCPSSRPATRRRPGQEARPAARAETAAATAWSLSGALPGPPAVCPDGINSRERMANREGPRAVHRPRAISGQRSQTVSHLTRALAAATMAVAAAGGGLLIAAARRRPGLAATRCSRRGAPRGSRRAHLLPCGPRPSRPQPNAALRRAQARESAGVRRRRRLRLGHSHVRRDRIRYPRYIGRRRYIYFERGAHCSEAVPGIA